MIENLTLENTPDEAGEAAATAYLVLEAAGYIDPRSALIDLANFVADGLSSET